MAWKLIGTATPGHVRRKISTSVDGDLSRGSSLRRPGSEYPQWARAEFCLVFFFLFLWEADVRGVFISTAQLVYTASVNCRTTRTLCGVRCPLYLVLFFFSSFSATYFFPRRGCPRVMKFWKKLRIGVRKIWDPPKAPWGRFSVLSVQ
jgi:hypothetical protein